MKGTIHLLVFSILMLLAIAPAKAQCTDIFISEYVEGSGFNKALELYNPTANPINLSNYRLAQYNNGSNAPGPFSNLSGIIQPYGTRVIVLDKRTGGTVVDAALQAKADTFMNPTNTAEVMNFNGNDAIVLQRLNGTVVDLFGKINQDPGSSGWGSGGNTTTNHTLVRKPTVTQGVTTSPATFDPTVEWIFYAEDFFDSLGTHLSNCLVPTCNVTLSAPKNNVACFGGSTGSVTLSATGGTAPYTYNATPTTNLAAGTYTYIVTDALSCADTVTVTITQPAAALNLNVTHRDVSCGSTNNGQVYAVVTGGTTPYAYTWSGGTPTPTNDSIINLAAGIYNVTVTDANNCSSTGSIQVNAPVQAQQPSAIAGDNVICLGNETYTVPTQTGVTFAWAVSSGGTITPNGNQATIAWTSAGTHTISVTASTFDCGNAPVQTLQVTASDVLTTPVITGADTVCLPGTETYTASVPGATNYTWTLSTGGTITPSGATASVVWNTVGTHTLTLTVSNACGLTSEDYTVMVGNPSVSLGNDTSACGQVNLAVSGFPTVLWSTGATTNQVTITQSANVGVTVTDALGCQASDVVGVTVTPGPILNLPATAGDCDTAVVNAPNTFTTYAWSNGQTTSEGTFTQNGTYTLTVTSANGCTVTDDVLVTIFPEPNPGIPATANDCDTVEVTATAGFTTYQWSDSQTGQVGTFFAPGTYSLTVTDNNGCTASASTTVSVGFGPVADFFATPTGLDVDFTFSGGAADTYDWDFGDGTSSTDASPSITYAAEGTYTVTLTVTNDCGTDTYTEDVTVVSIGIGDEMAINALQVYPNPTNSQLQVTWGVAQGNATIEVWNTLGVKLSTHLTHAADGAFVVPVSDLSSGMYLLRLQVGEQSKMVKFVKE